MNNQKSDDSLIDHYMAEIRKRLPVVDRALALYGDMPLSEYLNVVTETASERYQSADDLGDAVYEYAAPLLGEEAAAMAREELKQSPVVLTANHHGVDYFAQSVQGTLLFSQRKLPDGQRAKTVPVMACGSISMNNLTYPRGMLAYDWHPEKKSAVITKIPIFSNQVTGKAVTWVPNYDSDSIKRTEKSVLQMVREKRLSEQSANVIIEILHNEYLSPDLLALNKYSDQAVILNSQLWSRMFASISPRPELLYLEMEKVCSILLKKDLMNVQSLLSFILFDYELRKIVLTSLNQVKGCWVKEELEQRWLDKDCPQKLKSKSCGTFLFWWIDEEGRRVPLLPMKIQGRELLRGVDDRGKTVELLLENKSLSALLDTGQLLPSVFACFLAMTLARGITCAGGYYQAEYLALMKQGLCNALKNVQGYEELAAIVVQARTDSYLSGMQTIMAESGGNGVYPLGPLELIGKNALTAKALLQFDKISVIEAHRASIVDTFTDAASDIQVSEEQWLTVARELAKNESLIKVANSSYG
ncbi:MAG: hypothetical protein ACJAT7_000243 [Psychromonas sp.]|jgi:hypothetical protein|uniref:hypothetical protein n=1 Tax=Psychromonas sp. TaxID=1884585 RepID=UPI0039E42BC3